MNRPLETTNFLKKPAYRQFLLALLAEANLLTADRQPEPDQVKAFLMLPRGEALLLLFTTWRQAGRLNDLRMLPGLLCDGAWTNDPALPRELVLSILNKLDPATWWSLPSLLAQIKAHHPDFERPAGDYDSWFIRDEKTKTHLRGFENWEKVEGALLRYLIVGPLFWLGVLDLAHAEKNGAPLAFRLSALGSDLLKGQPPAHCGEENGVVTIASDGTFFISREVPRTLRYQLARFCIPISTAQAESKYRVTADSLRQAAVQGLRPTQLIQLLQQAKVKNLPQMFVESLERWEKYGPELTVEPITLLRLEKSELLPLLQKSPRVSRCLGEVLGPKAVLVKPGSVEPLRQALAEMGLLAEIKLE